MRHFRKTLPTEIWADLETNLFWAYVGPVEKNYLEMNYTKPHLTAWLIKSGGVLLKSPTAQARASSRMWVIFSGGKYEQYFQPKSRIVSVHFEMKWHRKQPFIVDNQILLLPAQKFPRLTGAALELSQFIKVELGNPARHTFHQPMSIHQRLELQEKSIRWYREIVRIVEEKKLKTFIPEAHDERIDLVIQLLETRPLNQPLDEKMLAVAAGLSKTHLNRLFRSHMGISVREYFDNRRFIVARNQARLPNHMIKEISSQLGFKYPSHFSRWFKQHEKKSPSTYQELTQSHLS